MHEVLCYLKNQTLGFTVPYAHEGTARAYLPDYIVRVRDGGAVTPLGCRPSSELCEGGGGPDLLNLILEVTGEKRKEKVAKVDAARTLWVPAVNNHGGFGRWAFLESTGPWNAKNIIGSHLSSRGAAKPS